MARVHLDAGWESGVGRRDVLTAIEREVGLARRDVGVIDVAARFSLVEVPGELAEHVIDALQGVRLNGRQVAVRHDRRERDVR